VIQTRREGARGQRFSGELIVRLYAERPETFPVHVTNQVRKVLIIGSQGELIVVQTVVEAQLTIFSLPSISFEGRLLT
jgi:hypothetical protein